MLVGPKCLHSRRFVDNSNGDEEHEVEVVHCAKKHKNCKGPFTIAIEVNEEKNSFM
jgi:hypothetical protein